MKPKADILGKANVIVISHIDDTVILLGGSAHQNRGVVRRRIVLDNQLSASDILCPKTSKNVAKHRCAFVCWYQNANKGGVPHVTAWAPESRDAADVWPSRG